MVVENLRFLDSLDNLPVFLKSMPKPFDLTCKNWYYPHFLKTANNLEYVDSYHETNYYGTDFMSSDERAQFSIWYKGIKDNIFRNRVELLAYCMDDVNVLRQACCVSGICFRNWSRRTAFGKSLQYRLFAQQGVPHHVPENLFCKHYPERGLPYGGQPVFLGSSMASVHWSDA